MSGVTGSNPVAFANEMTVKKSVKNAAQAIVCKRALYDCHNQHNAPRLI